MKSTARITAIASALAALAFGCTMLPGGGGGWTTLFDGKNLDNWNKVGDANWRIEARRWPTGETAFS